jgi:hypothetical protein
MIPGTHDHKAGIISESHAGGDDRPGDPVMNASFGVDSITSLVGSRSWCSALIPLIQLSGSRNRSGDSDDASQPKPQPWCDQFPTLQAINITRRIWLSVLDSVPRYRV